MNINRVNSGKSVQLIVSGKIGNATCNQFLEELLDSLKSNTRTVLDCTELEYINSTGLRALLQGMQKAEEIGADLVVKRVNEEISELFRITGFDELLNIVS